jgi:hypothetical protein
VGPERLERIMETIVGRLRDAGAVKGEIVVCDATFIKASVTQKMTLEAIAIQKSEESAEEALPFHFPISSSVFRLELII